MSAPGEAELAREARRIFRKLASNNGFLARHDAKSFAVCTPAGGNTRSGFVAAHVVAEFRRRDWLAPCGGGPERFSLSETGHGWYLRAVSPEDPFAAQHQLRTPRKMKSERSEHIVTLNEGESPLGWLKRRGTIDSVQCEAGERLRRDFTLAQLTPRMAVDLSAPVVLGRRGGEAQTALSEIVVAAKQRFTRALKAAGPGLSDLLFDVCCHLIGLEAAEQQKGWPRRSAKVVLCIALDRLAEHYGMRTSAPRRARMRSWQMEETR